MLAVALVPDTALLVPGAAGRATVLEAERSAALEAVGHLAAGRPGRIVVVTPAPRRPGPSDGTLAGGGLADAGVAPAPARGNSGPGGAGTGDAGGVAGAVALALLDLAGSDVPAEVVTAPGPEEARALGARLASGPPAALLLVGSLSARRGPDSPLAVDPRAEAFDDAVLRDLLDLGPAAVDRLAAVPRELADELAVSAWAPWQVLLGAVAATGHRVRTRPHHVGAPFGATYVVASWDLGAADGVP